MSEPHHPKVAAADHDVHELIRHRWSPRAFDPARSVSRADLLRLFEAARWAPSSLNEQPWRFVVVMRDQSPAAWEAVTASLSPSNRSWASAAPVLVLTATRLMLERHGQPNQMACYDAGQAVALLTVQATAQGLSVRQMEGFDHEQARKVFDVPEGFDPIVMMAIGYAGDPETLSIDKHRVAERTPRRRRTVGDFVFENTWGQLYQREDA